MFGRKNKRTNNRTIIRTLKKKKKEKKMQLQVIRVPVKLELSKIQVYCWKRLRVTHSRLVIKVTQAGFIMMYRVTNIGGGAGAQGCSLPPPPQTKIFFGGKAPHVLVPKYRKRSIKFGKIFHLVIFSQIVLPTSRLAK